MKCYIGIDLGTSGCRAVAINEDCREVAQYRLSMPAPVRAGDTSQQDPSIWWNCVRQTLSGLSQQISGRYHVAAVAVDGTSGTLLLCDDHGRPLTPGLMYDDARAKTEAARISACAPAAVIAGSPTSSLAKLLHLSARIAPRTDFKALHQADWIAGHLTGRFGVSDHNNVLKLGYEVATSRWPPWLAGLDVDPRWLPEVLNPGDLVGTLAPPLAQELGLSADVRVIAGTTDSTASAIAAGVFRAGDAVTVLGSTLVVKIVTERPVSAPEYGVYSHRLGDLWLAGGASNTGGAVVAAHFTPQEIASLESKLRPGRPTGLDYYPLLKRGERFPVNDPELPPRLEPVPATRAEFFQGILEGIARIEAEAYDRLHELGCPRPQRVITIGGGTHNTAWRAIRTARLGVPVICAEHEEAAYGTAMLAKKGRPGNR